MSSVRRIILIFVAALAVAGLASLPVFRSTTNCGGNSAALAKCNVVAMFLHVESADKARAGISFLDPSPQFREALPALAKDSWLGDARFFVSDETFRLGDPGPPHVVYVCDRAYTNIPKRMFFTAPPRHAAVLSDGHSTLISTAEFAALDFSHFRDLGELYPNTPKRDE